MHGPFILSQELSILQDLGDLHGECKAHGNMGAVHLSLSNWINAVKCYTEQVWPLTRFFLSFSKQEEEQGEEEESMHPLAFQRKEKIIDLLFRKINDPLLE